MPDLSEMLSADYVSESWSEEQQSKVKASGPPNRPFRHSGTCRHRDQSDPQWNLRNPSNTSDGWQRACMCGSEVFAAGKGRPPRPDDDHPGVLAFRAEHSEHGPVEVEWNDDGYWQVHCRQCMSKRPFLAEARAHSDTGSALDLRSREDQRPIEIRPGFDRMRYGKYGQPYMLPDPHDADRWR